MKEIRPDDLTSTAVQVPLPFDIPAVEQIYTPNPRWDSLNIHHPYWDEVEEQPKHSEKGCDILDHEEGDLFGNWRSNTSIDLGYETILDFAPQHLCHVGGQFFKDEGKLNSPNTISVRVLGRKSNRIQKNLRPNTISVRVLGRKSNRIQKNLRPNTIRLHIGSRSIGYNVAVISIGTFGIGGCWGARATAFILAVSNLDAYKRKLNWSERRSPRATHQVKLRS